MNIFDVIKYETAGLDQQTAVIEGQTRISYGELIIAAEQVADLLKSLGVSRFQRVGLLAEDSIDYIIASLAVLSCSAVIVPVAPEQSAEEVDEIINRIDLDCLLAEARFLKGKQHTMLPAVGFTSKEFGLMQRTASMTLPPDYYSSNPAFIRFSSGTTGASKGVLLSHESIFDRTEAADKGMQITPEDTVLWVLSMSFHFVVTILLFLRRGATLVLCSHRFPEALIDGILVHRGSFIYASPFHYNLLSRTDLLAADSLKQVRMAISTAMKLPEQTAEAFYNRFGFELTEAYGIIEVGLPFIKVSGGREKRGSVGRALPDFELWLESQDAEGVGEIFIKGKGLLDAYFSPWQKRDELLKDGLFKTGDLGKIDSDGFLFIVGRGKDVINFVGMKIFSQEVESVINQHPQVKESLVYGVPHPQYGELPTADVVLLDSGGEGAALIADLRRFCYQKLARYKVPKEFNFVASIPKTASGKIRRIS